MNKNYNTERDKITMSEYGRMVQQMVDYCKTIQDNSERLTCARSIVEVMARITDESLENPDVQSKLWNHLAIISDFTLDIDYPVDIIRKEEAQMKPKPLELPNTVIRHRHYGHILEEAIACLKDMEEGEERDFLTRQVADRMRQSLFTWNPDVMSEEKIVRDLDSYTGSSKVSAALDGHKYASLQNIPTSLKNKKKKK